MRKTSWGVAAALLFGAVVAVASLAGAATNGSAATRPAIIIGWAFDSKGNMAPFDGPALAAAKIHVRRVNAKGGVNGRPLRIITCDTNNNNPARAKSCARSLLGKGAHVIFVTCDVDFATPVVQEAINRGKLTIAPCIGTDQMGPKRFGRTKGKLAFSFGNVAQDEGSAMAEYAIRRGWRTAGLGTNTLLVYFKNVVQAFEKRYTQLGGRIVARESYATGANNVQTAVNRLNQRRAAVARAPATEPGLVLRNEPAAGLPEAEVPDFASVVRSVRDDHNAGVLLIDHNMALVMSVCDRIVVLDQGRTLAEGTPAEIRGNLDVAAA